MIAARTDAASAVCRVDRPLSGRLLSADCCYTGSVRRWLSPDNLLRLTILRWPIFCNCSLSTCSDRWLPVTEMAPRKKVDMFATQSHLSALSWPLCLSLLSRLRTVDAGGSLLSCNIRVDEAELGRCDASSVVYNICYGQCVESGIL